MASKFCPLPWNSINIRNNGDLRLCCNANSYSPQRGILRKEDGTSYNASKDDFTEARNAPLLKEVRLSMLKGDWHPECTRCQKEEDSGILSRRQMELRDWEITEEYAASITEEDGTIDTDKQDIDYFDIRYGNFCNLKCRMCGPTDSHQWYDDFVQITGQTSYKDTHEKIHLTKNKKGRWDTDQYDWFKNSNMYWNNFEKHTKNAKKLYIVGGEPMIIEEHIESLERLVANGTAKDIQIEYNTNLTNVTDRILNLWKHFKEIRIGASIDACNDIFNYQRFPANWNQVYENLKKIESRSDINFKCWYAFTITPLNVFHFPDFIKWKIFESGLTKFNSYESHRPLVSYHMCHSPKYYNIKVLPMDIKQKVLEKYDTDKKWMQDAVIDNEFSNKIKTYFVNHLESVEKFMMSEDYSAEWLPEFVRITKKLDEIRKQDIKQVVPELKSLFE
jgi:hypothetical protein